MSEETNTFSFQGVKGAYSELAGTKIYPGARSVPCKTFEEMFECVREDKANTAIVPIENSRAGRVADAQRLIPNSKLKIIGEFFLDRRKAPSFFLSFFLSDLRMISMKKKT